MSAPANSLKEKVQNLPLLCVEAICQFSPTSKLIRAYSAEVPLPGAFWQVAVEAALEKRLPLSLDDGLQYHQADQASDTAVLLFDKAGAKVAVIKQREALRFSPLREFVQSAALAFRIASNLAYYPNEVRLFALKSAALLSPLPNVKQLLIVLCKGAAETRLESGNHPAANHLQHLLSQLESLVVRVEDSDSVCNYHIDALVAELRHALLPLREMSSLRALALPEAAFRYAADDQQVLAGLVSLGVSAGGTSMSVTADVRAQMLCFLSTRCLQVSFLSVVVRGDFNAYATAFRAFANLSTLVLYFERTEVDLTGMTFGESERILSVSDLRIIRIPRPDDQLFSVASLFPNVKALALQSVYGFIPPFDLASAFCARNTFPALAKLSCFSADSSSYPIVGLAQFVAAPQLPEAVDLSQILLESFARDGNLLTDVYRALQANSVKKLLVRGPMHREALPRLQSSLDFTGEKAEVCAWNDRDLGEQPGNSNFPQISKFTDFRIVGTKTSGNLKGQQFTIRVFHQRWKREYIFD